MRLTFLSPLPGMEFLAAATILGKPVGHPGAADAVNNRAMAMTAIPIHDNISPMQFVIPGLTKPVPYLIRGNPVLSGFPLSRD